MTTLLTEAYLSIFCYAAEATAPCIGYGGLRLFERLTHEEGAALVLEVAAASPTSEKARAPTFRDERRRCA